MKAVIVGVVIGSAISLYLCALYLSSLWLPVTAIAVFFSGVVGQAFNCHIKPALYTSVVLVMLYFCLYWIPPEVLVRTANTPDEHFKAARAIGNRAQIFGDKERELEQYKLAAQGGHAEAAFVLGAYYDYGYNGLASNKSEAITYYQLAAERGYNAPESRLAQLLGEK